MTEYISLILNNFEKTKGKELKQCVLFIIVSILLNIYLFFLLQNVQSSTI